ncbi:MAG: hypothetical protein ACE5NC_08490 [Anaerolineae bacterium]
MTGPTTRGFVSGAGVRTEREGRLPAERNSVRKREVMVAVQPAVRVGRTRMRAMASQTAERRIVLLSDVLRHSLRVPERIYLRKRATERSRR